MKTKAFYINMRIVIALLLNIAIIQFSYAGPTGPGASWQFVRKITLSAATSTADFQVKITLVAGQYTNIKANGDDLRFYDNNNSPCNYWIENWNAAGTSTIWVKVSTSGTTILFMYYGNAAATAASDGASTFDFFDDFNTALGANWSSSTNGSGSSVTQSGTVVTLTCGTNTTGSAYLSSAFTPGSASFIVETKNQEPKYNRNRFYAGTSLFGSNPFGFDNGYFYNGSGAQNNAQIFWNGSFQSSTTVTAGTNYLTQWQITDGSTYNWNTYVYSSMALVKSNNPSPASVPSDVRFITIGVTEVSGTSTVVDWVRVRKSNSTFADPTATVGSQANNNLSASINTQTNVLCFGKSTGAATVTTTGGASPLTYSWNSSPIQTTTTASNLPAGDYTVTVTDNTGISATASVTITQPASVVTASVFSQTPISCFNTSTGQIIVQGNGGTGSFTYSIFNGVASGMPLNLPAYQSSATFNALPAGQYKIRVMDSNGCESKQVQ